MTGSVEPIMSTQNLTFPRFFLILTPFQTSLMETFMVRETRHNKESAYETLE